MASNIITPSFDPVIFPGFSESGSYDAHRPSYHPPAVAYLLTSLGVVGKHGATVIDMGAGTGKFTEILASREEEFEIIAVEPHEDMRQVLVAKKLPRTLVMEESVYTVWSRKQYPGALELEGCAQAVVVAQVFFIHPSRPSVRPSACLNFFFSFFPFFSFFFSSLLVLLTSCNIPNLV